MKRTIRFTFLLSEEERDTVKSLAEFHGGLSDAALIRLIIREAAKRQNLWPPKQGAA